MALNLKYAIEASVFCDQCGEMKTFDCYEGKKKDGYYVIVFTCKICRNQFVGSVSEKEWEATKDVVKFIKEQRGKS